MSNTVASLKLGASLDGGQQVVQDLQNIGNESEKTTGKVEKGAEKSTRAYNNLSTTLRKIRVDAIANGDAVQKALLNAQVRNPDLDITKYQSEINWTKQAIAWQDQLNAKLKQEQDEARKAAQEYAALQKQIDQAIAKAESGMSSTSAGYLSNLAGQRNIQLTDNTRSDLQYLQALQTKQAQEKALQQNLMDEARAMQSKEDAFISQINRLTDSFATAGMTASDRMLHLAKKQGLDPKMYEPLIAELKKAEAEYDKLKLKSGQAGSEMMKNGMTAKQFQAALRGVPAQMTDIVVSLQGGQRPLTVLLQQGGQLKDMFGGVKEAAVAVGGYLKQMLTGAMSFITPVTAGITGVVAILGTLAAAAKTASDEFLELDSALARAGNIAGSDASALMGLKDNIASITGSSKAAGEAVTALAKDGRLSFDEMSDSAKLLANMMIATGKSAEELAPKIENIYVKPSEAAVELNKDIRFLSEEVYNNAKAFEKQGRFAEASALIMREVGSSSEDVSRRVQSNAQAMASAWQGVKEAIVSAWRALVAFYTESKTQKINSAFDDQEAQLGAIGRLDSSAMDDLDRRRKKALADVKSNTKEVEKQLNFERKIARGNFGQGKTGKSKTGRAKSGGSRAESSYQSLSQSITEKTDAVKQELLYGSKLTETDKLIIKINAEQANGKKKLTDAHKDELLQRANTLKQLEKELEVKKFMQKFDENFAKDKEKLVNKYRDEIAVLGMGTEEAKAHKEAIDIARKGEEQYQEALKKGANEEQLRHIREATQDLIDTNEELRQQYQRGFNNPFIALTESIKKYSEEAQNTGKQMRDAFDNAFKNMEDAFVQFVTTGKLSFKDLVNSILADMARMAAQRAVSGFLDGIMQIGARAIAGWMGGGSTTTTTTTSAYPTNSDVRVGYQHRAVGGPVNSGSPYIIGEKGPELFIPSQSGKVIPNNQLGGAIGAGGFNIQISHRNEGTQQQVTSSGADFDGKNLIIKIVTQDIANDGQISRTMSKTFGMRRAAGAM